MNKMHKLVLGFLILLVTASSYSAEPLVKFYLSDGTFKSYDLNEIDNLQFPNAPDTLQLQVFTRDSTFYYPAQLIDSVKLFVDDTNEDRIHLWHDGFKWDFGIHEIDSILIYYTKYVAVTIGTQHWMYRNLDVDHYRNGDSIPEVRDSAEWQKSSVGAWCNLNNDSETGKIYGKLYNWYAMHDPRDLSPVGWRIPRFSEWRELIEYIGGYSFAGAKAKEAGLEHWKEPNTSATNESGFTALPAGIRANFGGFGEIGYYTAFWGGKFDLDDPIHTYLYYNDLEFGNTEHGRTYGCSIRCIKNK